MRIENMRRPAHLPDTVTALFDLAVDDGLMIMAMALRRAGNGEMRVFSPKAQGQSCRAVQMHPAFATTVTAAAIEAAKMKGLMPNDHPQPA